MGGGGDILGPPSPTIRTDTGHRAGRGKMRGQRHNQTPPPNSQKEPGEQISRRPNPGQERVLAGTPKQRRRKPAPSRRKADGGAEAAGRGAQKDKSNAGERAPPHPPFTGSEENLNRVKGASLPCGDWGKAPKRSATSPPKKKSPPRRENTRQRGEKEKRTMPCYTALATIRLKWFSLKSAASLANPWDTTRWCKRSSTFSRPSAVGLL